MLTQKQLAFITDAIQNGLDQAKESLLTEKKKEMADTFANTPATEKEIISHAKVAAKTFLTELNKALHSLAGEIRK